MSEPCIIGLFNPKSNTIRSIYCHHEGYPGSMGPMLTTHYNNADKINKLLDLGNISYLGTELNPAPGQKHNFDHPAENVTIAYIRDDNRDPEEESAKTFKSKKQFAQNTNGLYTYMYDTDRQDWMVMTSDNRFIRLPDKYRKD